MPEQESQGYSYTIPLWIFPSIHDRSEIDQCLLIAFGIKTIETTVSWKSDTQAVKGHPYPHSKLEFVVIKISGNLQESTSELRRIIPPQKRAQIKGRIVHRHGLEVNDIEVSIICKEPVCIADIVV